MTVRHITFATKAFLRSAEELRRSVQAFGIESRIYRPSTPPVQSMILRQPAKMLARRGAGYWRWKPVIIEHALRNAADSDYVFYTDAGMTMIADPSPLIALAESAGILLFSHATSSDGSILNPMSAWTKRDCFVLMNADNPRFWTANQLLGGFAIFRKDDASFDFLRRWGDACSDDRLITDRPNRAGLPDLPGFVAHRHDQSILSILALQSNVVTVPDPSQFGMGSNSNTGGQIFDLHRRRKLGVMAALRPKLRLKSRLRSAFLDKKQSKN